MAKRVSRHAWKASYAPGWNDFHIERAWLDEHWAYGGRIEECRKSHSLSVGEARFLADRYFAEDEIIRVAYNRAKHGSTLLRDSSLSEREFWVLAPHLSTAAVVERHVMTCRSSPSAASRSARGGAG